MAMARTQTLVQLSDELLAQLDARAAREGRNRSAIIREALDAYLAADRETEIDRLIVEGYTRQPQTAQELTFAELGTRTMLAGVEPWEDPLGSQEAGRDIAARRSCPQHDALVERDDEPSSDA